MARAIESLERWRNFLVEPTKGGLTSSSRNDPQEPVNRRRGSRPTVLCPQARTR